MVDIDIPEGWYSENKYTCGYCEESFEVFGTSDIQFCPYCAKRSDEFEVYEECNEKGAKDE